MATGSAITIVAPQSIQESEQLSEKLARSGLMPDALKGKPSDIMATLLAGAELGLAPMQALRSIVIIKGKPTLSADLMGALVKRSSVCGYLRLVESTPQRATYETQRVGEPKPTVMTFSAEDATRAGLNGDNWRKYPAAMLRARCLSAICRAVYPDLCLGLYDSDSGEISDAIPPLSVVPPPVERDVTPHPVAAPRTATARVAQAVAAKVSAPAPSLIVDVREGESETEAAALHSARERCIALGKKAGFDKGGFGAWVGMNLGGKGWSATTMEDIAMLIALLEKEIEPPPDVVLPTDAAQGEAAT